MIARGHASPMNAVAAVTAASSSAIKVVSAHGLCCDRPLHRQRVVQHGLVEILDALIVKSQVS